MKIEVPEKMWKRFADALLGDRYCHLCDHHPWGEHYGHAEDCPLYREQPAVKEGAQP